MRAAPTRVVVATDDMRVRDAVVAHGIDACMTRADHADRHRSPGRGRAAARAGGRRHRRQRAGRRAAARPGADPGHGGTAGRAAGCGDRHRLSSDRRCRRSVQSQCRQGGARRRRLRAVFQPRDDSVGARRLSRNPRKRCRRDCRCTGITDSMRIASSFLRAFPALAPAPIEALRGARAIARAMAWLPDRRRDHARHAGAGHRHARGPGARARDLCAGSRLRRVDRPADNGENRTRTANDAGQNTAEPATLGPHARATRPPFPATDHATDSVGPAGRRQGHPGHVHQGSLRHSADFHRRHAARRRQGRARRSDSPRRR